ncbi:hypothetical protein SODALDRAFT_329035 [Sodiomyces alkalinus F11]|uniref:Uncharacterized protein n=1 Tax=Sodiomyces alkalinus (strain CBS 110278 / VKM F-3762 / F11) TaxID=1314773 RepID=A0A3N2PMA8_SODAK|nr:hypothetical protein SODALDRAFT_329035 [Sodiomyces alkalinus F11]ROT35667.1 hypothetical protein SODALDRAFT_329035 [Sodiomyces alkalinus F11]
MRSPLGSCLSSRTALTRLSLDQACALVPLVSPRLSFAFQELSCPLSSNWELSRPSPNFLPITITPLLLPTTGRFGDAFFNVPVWGYRPIYREPSQVPDPRYQIPHPAQPEFCLLLDPEIAAALVAFVVF